MIIGQGAFARISSMLRVLASMSIGLPCGITASVKGVIFAFLIAPGERT